MTEEISTSGNRSVEIIDGINGLQKVVLHQHHGSSVEVRKLNNWSNNFLPIPLRLLSFCGMCPVLHALLIDLIYNIIRNDDHLAYET